MALIKCPECGREISESADNCPNCGYHLTKTKFCKFCGEKIPVDSIICTKCGRQVENIDSGGKGIIINNSNSSSASASSVASASVTNVRHEYSYTRKINKTVALILCIFLGYLGAHKFYEGKIGLGILYLCTFGLFGIGWVIDIIVIAGKPNPYYI